MNYDEELDKAFNKVQNNLAVAISALLRRMENREERISAMNKMENPPTIEILKRVNKIALQNEDYETCEAINEYCKSKGIII